MVRSCAVLFDRATGRSTCASFVNSSWLTSGDRPVSHASLAAGFDGMSGSLFGASVSAEMADEARLEPFAFSVRATCVVVFGPFQRLLRKTRIPERPQAV